MVHPLHTTLHYTTDSKTTNLFRSRFEHGHARFQTVLFLSVGASRDSIMNDLKSRLLGHGHTCHCMDPARRDGTGRYGTNKPRRGYWRFASHALGVNPLTITMHPLVHGASFPEHNSELQRMLLRQRYRCPKTVLPILSTWVLAILRPVSILYSRYRLPLARAIWWL